MESIIKQISRTSIKNGIDFAFYNIFIWNSNNIRDTLRFLKNGKIRVRLRPSNSIIRFIAVRAPYFSSYFSDFSIFLCLSLFFYSSTLPLFLSPHIYWSPAIVHSWLTSNKYCFDWKLINLDLVFFRSIEKCAYFAHLRSNLCCECECARLVFVICTKPIGEYHANDGFNRWAKCISLRPMHCNTQIDRTY